MLCRERLRRDFKLHEITPACRTGHLRRRAAIGTGDFSQSRTPARPRGKLMHRSAIGVPLFRSQAASAWWL
jgi:hypothetical protein